MVENPNIMFLLFWGAQIENSIAERESKIPPTRPKQRSPSENQEIMQNLNIVKGTLAC
jgi:hypothetical protein